MKRIMTACALIALLLTPVGRSEAQGSGRIGFSMSGPRAEVSAAFFYDDLAPYGEWADDPNYGWCWAPYDVSSDWRPYYDGYWVSTVDGWCWVSNEPWGWATYHYGRWVFDPYRGWLWVPGSVWAPAWVAWHCSDDWIGWAPLPLSAGWDYSSGLRYVDFDQIPARGWCFVSPQHFLERRIRSVAVSPYQNIELLKQTRDATYMEARDGRPINRGVDVRVVERTSGRRVETHRVVTVASPDQARGTNVRRGSIGVFRPEFRRSQSTERVAPRMSPAPRSAQRVEPQTRERNMQWRRQPPSPPPQKATVVPPPPTRRTESPQRPQPNERQQINHERAQKRKAQPRHGR